MRARSIQHLGELFRLADAAGLLPRSRRWPCRAHATSLLAAQGVA